MKINIINNKLTDIVNFGISSKMEKIKLSDLDNLKILNIITLQKYNNLEILQIDNIHCTGQELLITVPPSNINVIILHSAGSDAK